MKKILTLVTLAAIAATASADNTTLYGSVRMAYTFDSAGDKIVSPKGISFDGTSKFGNSGSRFGIKGSDDLGNGLKAIYQYENRIKDNLNTNELWVGLEGGFGKVTVGKQDLPHEGLANNTDPFNAITPGHRNFHYTVKETSGMNSDYKDYSEGVQTSSDNSLVYYTPDMSGFKLGLGLVADGKSGDKHLDGYSVAAEYNANGIYAGLGYEETNRGSSTNENDFFDVAGKMRQKTLGLGLGYSTDNFSIGLLAEKTKFKGADLRTTYVRLGGTYNVSEMDSIYAGVSKRWDKLDDEKLPKPMAASIGYQHKLSNRTRIWAEYGYSKDYNITLDKASGEWLSVRKSTSSTVSLGLRTDF